MPFGQNTVPYMTNVPTNIPQEHSESLSSVDYTKQLRIAKISQIEELGFSAYAVESHRDFTLLFIKFWFDFVAALKLDEVITDIAPLTLDYFLHQVLFPKNVLEQAEEQLQIRVALKSMGLDPDDERFKGQGIPEKIISYRKYFPLIRTVSDEVKYALMNKFLIHKNNEKSVVKEADVRLKQGQKVTLAGRLKSKRVSGKIAFGTIEDESYPDGFQFIFRSDLLAKKPSHHLQHIPTSKEKLEFQKISQNAIEIAPIHQNTKDVQPNDTIVLHYGEKESAEFRLKATTTFPTIIEAYTSNLDFQSILKDLPVNYTIQDLRSAFLIQYSAEYLAELEQGIVVYFLEPITKSMNFDQFRELFDEGDYLQASGFLEYSRSGEASLVVDQFSILTKSLRPLPENLEYDNVEYRYLNRVADFKNNTRDPRGLSVREMLYKKSRFWQIWREELNQLGFLEVECPVFEHTPGGAEAKPFTTFYDVLDQEMYLRISLELPLKRLIAGGFEKIYEIGRIFRNEGASPQHLQEYTQMEFYWSYADYHDCMEFIQRVYRRQILELTGSLTTIDYSGQLINWGEWVSDTELEATEWELQNGWPMITFYEAVRLYSEGKADVEGKDLFALQTHATELGVKFESNYSKARLMDLIWKKAARPHVINPIFMILPPVELEPLAKRDPVRKELTQRFQVVAGGAEIGKGFSELNDPLDQLSRFQEQQTARDNGDREAQFMDMEYIEALEYGLPPLTGFGISERFFSFIMGKPIKELVTFPAVRKITPNNLENNGIVS